MTAAVTAGFPHGRSEQYTHHQRCVYLSKESASHPNEEVPCIPMKRPLRASISLLSHPNLPAKSTHVPTLFDRHDAVSVTTLLFAKCKALALRSALCKDAWTILVDSGKVY